MKRIYMTIMLSVPWKEKSIYEDETTLEIILRMDSILKKIDNNIPNIKLAPLIIN